MAYLALFIALGGTSYGLATGSIGSRELKNNAVRSKDLKNSGIQGVDVRSGTLRSVHIADSSLVAADFAPGQLQPGPPGERGPMGPHGLQGNQGIQGPPGITSISRVEVESASTNQTPKQVTATCPPGKQLVGTGFDVFGGKHGTTNEFTDISIDFVIPGSASVTVAGYEVNPTDVNWRVKAIAICATVG